MFKRNSKRMAGAALCAVLLAGCGGDGGRSGEGPPAEQTITAVVEYLKDLINGGENIEPIDINPLTLATDDTSEPVPLE